MGDQDKTKQELIEELDALRRRVATFEAAAKPCEEEEGGDLPEGWWRSLVAHAPLFMVVVDRDLRIRYVNHTDSGLPREAVRGRSLLDLSLPQYRSAIQECAQRVFATGEPCFHESQAVRPDGQLHWYQGHLGPIFENGRVAAVSVIAVNASEGKRAQQALQEAHESLERRVAERTAELQGLVDALPDAVVMSGLDGRVVFASEQTARLLKLADAASLVGQSVFDYVVEADRPRLAANIAKLAEVGVRRGTEYTVLCRDGTTVPVEISSVALRDRQGQITAVTAVIRDISERKKAQEALRASEERFRVAFEEAPVGIVIGVGDGVIAKANAALARLSGYTQEELVGRHVRDLTHPDDRDLTVPLVRQLLAGEIPSFTVEKRYVRKDGTAVWAQATTAAVRDPDGKIAFALGIVEDISARREARQSMERERRTLTHLLAASDHERQLIAYDIHDGLAQQLAGAIMQFQVYGHLKDARPDEAARAFELGTALLQQGHGECRRLISGVRPPILDESGVVAAIAHLVNAKGSDARPRIQFRSQVMFQRLATVLENSIYRIVQEGLSNACEHSQSDLVRVGLVQRGQRVRIEIRDWGIGFDVNRLPDNRFGLEGIRERTRLLGGVCKIRSRPGRGTSLVVELPLMERKAEE